jgi:SP family general alpha glucoside:H+ symporter-like MFS transporter
MIDAQIEIMKQANEMEKLNAANSSFRDCFRGVNTKRTIIGLMCWLIQQCNGETLTSYATLFLQNAGMKQTDAFVSISLRIKSHSYADPDRPSTWVFKVSTCWPLELPCTVSFDVLKLYTAELPVIGRIGRRPMYLTGIGLMGFFMLIIGIIGSIPSDNTAIGIGAMLVVIRVTFKTTLGPTCCKSNHISRKMNGMLMK